MNKQELESKKQELKEKGKELRKKNKGFLDEFKTFINRGNVVDLAVGVIIGGAFTTIVNSLVADILMPILSLIGGGFDFTELAWKIRLFGGDSSATIAYGNFLQNVINFLIIAFCVFIVVRFTNNMREKAEKLKKKSE